MGYTSGLATLVTGLVGSLVYTCGEVRRVLEAVTEVSAQCGLLVPPSPPTVCNPCPPQETVATQACPVQEESRSYVAVLLGVLTIGFVLGLLCGVLCTRCCPYRSPTTEYRTGPPVQTTRVTPSWVDAPLEPRQEISEPKPKRFALAHLAIRPETFGQTTEVYSQWR